MIRHLILDNKWKKIIFVSSAFLITGIILNVHVYLTDCKRAINRIIKNDFRGKRTAVYIINDAHIECRPCFKYDELSKDKNIDIMFYVRKDFSDNDIENFRDAFKIPIKYTVKRIKGEWEKIYKRCNKNKFNLLILLNNKKVKEIRRF